MINQEVMDFPSSIYEFLIDYSFKDSDEVYTNGISLIPTFRVKQAIEHYFEQTRWIPVSERLPKELEPVNITWVNHNPQSYYANIKEKPFTATGVYFNGQWYWWSTLCTDILAEYSHNYSDIIDDDIEITAWMPLPEPYKIPEQTFGCAED